MIRVNNRFFTHLSRPLAGFALAILLATPGGDLAAQIVRGQVVDSVSQAPVAGGVVVLVTADGSEVKRTITDEEGLFLIRAASPGTYSLRVEAAAYPPSDYPTFDLATDQMQGFLLLVSAETPREMEVDSAIVQLLARACGADFVPDLPVVIGRVVTSGSAEPVDSAEIVMTWSTVPDFLQPQVGYDNALGTATTGSTGFYAVCGAPVGTDIVVHAESQGRLSELVSLRFEDNGVFVRDSFLVMTNPIWRQDFTLYSPRELTGSISGTVMDTAGARVANARVTVPGTTMLTRANFLGDFTLTGLPPGTIRLSAEQVGYSQFQTDVQLEFGQQLTLPATTLALANAPVELDPITVEAERSERRRDLVEFEKRKATTSGQFITRDEWIRMGSVDETVDVIRRLRGIRVRNGPDMTQPWIITSSRSGGRGAFNSTLEGGQCYPLIFLDRRYIGDTGQVSIDREINLQDLEAVEFHSSTAGMPAELNRAGAVCGVLVFWTR